MTEKLKQLQSIIDGTRDLVFFGGAGVSTESGIPDFRSVDGLYNQKYPVPPEVILSHTYYEKHPEQFFDFYRDKMLFLSAKPNPAHRWLARLEAEGRLAGVVTQNIDGLHQAAGSRKVWELHGSVHRNKCRRCGKQFSAHEMLQTTGVPVCPDCGGRIKPEVVLYEEPLDEAVIEGALDCIRRADTMIIAGTSLTVYPAAGLIRYFRGENLVLINRDPTPADDTATLCIHDKVGQVLGGIAIGGSRI